MNILSKDLSEEQIKKILEEFKIDCAKYGVPDDWWTAIPDEYDVNIWMEDPKNSNNAFITVYPLDNNNEVDWDNFTRIASFDISEIGVIEMKKFIQVEWNVTDVMIQAENDGISVDVSEAIKILLDIQKNHDASIGVNWDVISYHVRELERMRNNDKEK